MRLTMAAALAAAMAGFGQPGSAQENETIERAVRACIELVHRIAPADWQGPYYLQFDAYYNRASGKIPDNGWRNGDVAPRYEFEKCMAGRGIPLTRTGAGG
jgi:hypothetical protein